MVKIFNRVAATNSCSIRFKAAANEVTITNKLDNNKNSQLKMILGKLSYG